MVIYKITNLLNGKIYIGQTKQKIEYRFLQHSKANSPLGQAMRDCGLENFTIEIIEHCENQAELNEREKFWIKVLKSKIPYGYNQIDGGGGFQKSSKRKNFIPSKSIENLPTEKINNRIKFIRKKNFLTQTEFGIKIGLKQRTIADIESGRTTLTERNFEAICRVFNVNPEWLRDNVGDMFMPQKKSQYLDLLIEEYGLGNEHKVLIESILELPPEVWSSVIEWIKNCASKICLQNSDFVRENRIRELEAQINQARQELAEMNMEYVDKTNDSLTCEKNIFNAENETIQN